MFPYGTWIVFLVRGLLVFRDESRVDFTIYRYHIPITL